MHPGALPEASVLFLPPPVNAEHPERASLSEQFRRGAAAAFADAGWEFRELDLSKRLSSEWRRQVLAALAGRPGIVFSYQNDLLAFLQEIAQDERIGDIVVVLALVEPEQDVSPRILELQFHPEDLGFIGGVMAAELTTDGHVALYAFSDDYYSDRFVAGFWQGLMTGRSGASLCDLRVLRGEVADAEAGTELMARLLSRVNKQYDPRFAVDVLAFWTCPLGQDLARDIAAGSVPVMVGVVPTQDTTIGAPVTSLYYDFSAIPRYLVDNAEELGLYEARELDGAGSGEEGESRGEQATVSSGPRDAANGPRRVHIRMDSGLMKVGSFDDYLRYHTLPADFKKTVDFYVRSLQVGELEVEPELRKAP